ncbi:HigA family addiction module antidote protein [Haematospirillum jordaniae]|uniref:HigA family addiction module antitoxin n=1 Tax=Haematospirillum jordaniae TaxID=1549855 RepID=UPI0009EEEDB5|nr:HigA family addiction module antitoxin [Haematospirillum jordaniae]NKD46220.1 HigA family addiction module antidote protein [Haematospirillum jordaniae]NKD58137.1 HigA family addiction module antidote protein [Haematospirillum jordaniae]NKD60246.1 HigA family addiction module antidote protein [Haematospirillum jordaniae]NKD68184.1 HigA family addiction module antidote protein [Haematospirillum jordaniae]NKD80189.1 HigA family addiction module antidote protein [Haematospirillum jordaniae]
MHNPPHPAEGLKDDLEALNLTTAQAAEALGISRQQLYRVLNQQSAISPEMALRLEAVIGVKADLWLRLQAAYDLAQARQNKANLMKRLRRLTVPALPAGLPAPMRSTKARNCMPRA